MKIKELSKFVNEVTLFWLFSYKFNHVSIIQWEGSLISCLDGWPQRNIMSDVCLNRVNSVPVEIILHQLALLESDKDCAKISQKGKGWVNL
jgi:hypothetical protein